MEEENCHERLLSKNNVTSKAKTPSAPGKTPLNESFFFICQCFAFRLRCAPPSCRRGPSIDEDASRDLTSQRNFRGRKKPFSSSFFFVLSVFKIPVFFVGLTYGGIRWLRRRLLEPRDGRCRTGGIPGNHGRQCCAHTGRLGRFHR